MKGTILREGDLTGEGTVLLAVFAAVLDRESLVFAGGFAVRDPSSAIHSRMGGA